jgi:hypothetical protein
LIPPIRMREFVVNKPREELIEFLFGKSLHLACYLLNCGCHNTVMILHEVLRIKLSRVVFYGESQNRIDDQLAR